jgi:tetratricopeptide (TPR) repeat protein
MRRTRAVLLLAAGLAASPAAGALPAGARPPDPPGTFRGQERVTAVDLALDVSGGGLPGFAHRSRPPGDLAASDLAVRIDGEPRPVVSLDLPGAGSEASARILLYFDLVLADEDQVAWGAARLLDHLDDLVSRGEVEIVVADPRPRTVVYPTRDTGELQTALARLSLRPRGEDALVTLRLQALEEMRAVTEPSDRPALVRLDAAREAALLQERLDTLLLALVERGAEASARRSVFLTLGGFDPTPVTAEGAGSGPATGALTPVASELSETAAAYGWLVQPLVRVEGSGLVPGWRIGKWRFGLGGRGRVPILLGALLGGATYEEDRDPKRARAYLDLAAARFRQRELGGAADAAESALVHFARDPRTADEQARALLLIARSWDGRGDAGKARRYYAKAARRDPEAVVDFPVTAALPRTPEAGPTLLAHGSDGVVVSRPEDMDAALAALDRRVIATVQLPGLPDGALHELAVTSPRTRVEVQAPARVRFGTPPPVAAARLRRLLADAAPFAGNLHLTAWAHPGRSPGTVRVIAQPDLSSFSADEGDTVLRATLGIAAPAGSGPEGSGATGGDAAEGGPPDVVELSRETLTAGARAVVPITGRVELPAGAVWGVVLVEDLSTGAWGAASVDLTDLEGPE